MTRTGRLLVGVVLASLVAGCAGPHRAAPTVSASASADLLFVGTSRGIAALHPDSGAVAYWVPGGVATPDWKVLYRTAGSGGGTALRALDPATGTALWSHHLAGKLTVKLATPGGTAVVLGPRYGSQGRPRTDLVVGQMGLQQPAFRTYHVPGNVEPEAMSLDRSTLFLIEYVPAMHPTGYQLRQLSLATGRLGDVRRVDEDETGVMQGVARTHVMSRDGSRLYTLYTIADRRAFVHVLDLRDKYAHCVDLPLPFGTGPQSAVALTLTPDGSRLFVADRHSGAAAVIDTARLTIDGTGDVPLAGSGGPASAVMGPDGTLYLASDTHLVEVLPMSLDYQDVIEMPDKITALGLAPDRSVVVGLAGEGLTVLSPANGRPMAHFRSTSFDNVRFIGAVAAVPLDDARLNSQCAC